MPAATAPPPSPEHPPAHRTAEHRTLGPLPRPARKEWAR